MKAFRGDLLQLVLDGQSLDDIFKKVTLHAKNLGFEYCAYGIRMPLPISKPSIFALNNYPDTWNELYEKQDYISSDPTIRLGLRSSKLIIWSDDVFLSTDRLWEDARDAGLRVGLAQSSREANGTAGLLSLSRGHEQLSELELNSLKAQISWLSQITHTAMSRLLAPTLAPEINTPLTNRETEVLKWAAAGKTSAETAQIIDLSERTTLFHINNAIQKLNCTNKTSAAVKAVSLGLLEV